MYSTKPIWYCNLKVSSSGQNCMSSASFISSVLLYHHHSQGPVSINARYGGRRIFGRATKNEGRGMWIFWALKGDYQKVNEIVYVHKNEIKYQNEQTILGTEIGNSCLIMDALIIPTYNWALYKLDCKECKSAECKTVMVQFTLKFWVNKRQPTCQFFFCEKTEKAEKTLAVMMVPTKVYTTQNCIGNLTGKICLVSFKSVCVKCHAKRLYWRTCQKDYICC